MISNYGITELELIGITVTVYLVGITGITATGITVQGAGITGVIAVTRSNYGDAKRGRKAREGM